MEMLRTYCHHLNNLRLTFRDFAQIWMRKMREMPGFRNEMIQSTPLLVTKVGFEEHCFYGILSASVDVFFLWIVQIPSSELRSILCYWQEIVIVFLRGLFL